MRSLIDAQGGNTTEYELCPRKHDHGFTIDRMDWLDDPSNALVDTCFPVTLHIDSQSNLSE